MSVSGYSLLVAVGLLALGGVNAWLVAVIGSGRLRRNHFVGIRTRATMGDDETWEKAHRAAAPGLRLTSILAAICAVAVVWVDRWPFSIVVMFVPLAMMVVASLIGVRAAAPPR